MEQSTVWCWNLDILENRYRNSWKVLKCRAGKGWKRLAGRIIWTTTLEKFTQILGILNNSFRLSAVQKFSIIKVCNALALPILLNGSEIWTLQQKGKKETESHRDEICQKKTLHPFWLQSNDEILEEVKAEPADKKLRRYKSNWLRHVTRMDNNRMPKIMLNYRPNGQRHLERPLTRL
jgi:hypothetical protein